MQPYRDIAVLAGTQVVCFLLLAQFEPSFVVIHLYQSILYLAILILLYYREDRWAYMRTTAHRRTVGFRPRETRAATA